MYMSVSDSILKLQSTTDDNVVSQCKMSSLTAHVVAIKQHNSNTVTSDRRDENDFMMLVEWNLGVVVAVMIYILFKIVVVGVGDGRV